MTPRKVSEGDENTVVLEPCAQTPLVESWILPSQNAPRVKHEETRFFPSE